MITGVSLIIPNFSDFLNIAGSLGASVIAFIIPPLMEMIEFKNEISKIKIGWNVFVMLFGAAGGAYSIYFSINEIIDSNN